MPPVDCPVCLQPARTPRKLECGHQFHARCIAKWFAETKIVECPCCRQPTLAWLSNSRAKLSTRLEIFVDTLQSSPETGFEPPDFWPAWLVGHLRDTAAFDDCEKVFLKDLSFQSFDRAGYFQTLRLLEASGEAAPGTSPPTRSNFLPKILS